MIILLIKLYIAIAMQTSCSMGQPADFYRWIDVHYDYRVAWSMESRVFGDYWIMQAGDDLMLFKFAEPIEDTIASGASHGECFRRLE